MDRWMDGRMDSNANDIIFIFQWKKKEPEIRSKRSRSSYYYMTQEVRTLTHLLISCVLVFQSRQQLGHTRLTLPIQTVITNDGKDVGHGGGVNMIAARRKRQLEGRIVGTVLGGVTCARDSSHLEGEGQHAHQAECELYLIHDSWLWLWSLMLWSLMLWLWSLMLVSDREQSKCGR